jgi:hypothetical protein
MYANENQHPTGSSSQMSDIGTDVFAGCMSAADTQCMTDGIHPAETSGTQAGQRELDPAGCVLI